MLKYTYNNLETTSNLARLMLDVVLITFIWREKMKTKSILFTLLSILFFSGCANIDNYNIIKTGEYQLEDDGKKENKVYFSDSSSDIENFKNDFRKLTDERIPEFKGSMIISKSGTKNSGGYNLSVDSIVDAGRYMVVTTILESPGKGCIVTMALTNPYIVIEIPDNHKEVEFVQKDVVVDCE